MQLNDNEHPLTGEMAVLLSTWDTASLNALLAVAAGLLADSAGPRLTAKTLNNILAALREQ